MATKQNMIVQTCREPNGQGHLCTAYKEQLGYGQSRRNGEKNKTKQKLVSSQDKEMNSTRPHNLKAYTIEQHFDFLRFLPAFNGNQTGCEDGKFVVPRGRGTREPHRVVCRER